MGGVGWVGLVGGPMSDAAGGALALGLMCACEHIMGHTGWMVAYEVRAGCCVREREKR